MAKKWLATRADARRGARDIQNPEQKPTLSSQGIDENTINELFEVIRRGLAERLAAERRRAD
jgi:hypothetical protein